jgi:hypothetical protein
MLCSTNEKKKRKKIILHTDFKACKSSWFNTLVKGNTTKTAEILVTDPRIQSVMDCNTSSLDLFPVANNPGVSMTLIEYDFPSALWTTRGV